MTLSAQSPRKSAAPSPQPSSSAAQRSASLWFTLRRRLPAWAAAYARVAAAILSRSYTGAWGRSAIDIYERDNPPKVLLRPGARRARNVVPAPRQDCTRRSTAATAASRRPDGPRSSAGGSSAAQRSASRARGAACGRSAVPAAARSQGSQGSAFTASTQVRTREHVGSQCHAPPAICRALSVSVPITLLPPRPLNVARISSPRDARAQSISILLVYQAWRCHGAAM